MVGGCGGKLLRGKELGTEVARRTTCGRFQDLGYTLLVVVCEVPLTQRSNDHQLAIF